jgi:hypothetical protein
MYTYNHADLNNDGREDLIYHTQTGFAVAMSTTSGTYAAPVSYDVPDREPSGTVSLDLNNDGKLEVVAFNGFAPGIYVYRNTGDGTVKLQSTYAMADVQDVVVGDFNHDGYPDLALLVTSGGGQTIRVLFNNKNGGFTAGPTTDSPVYGEMTAGDFDGDGAADLAVTSNTGTYLFFGDNTGTFKAVNATTTHEPEMFLMDIDGDGKSDLVGAASAGSDGMYPLLYRAIWVVYGNASRTIAETKIPLNGYVDPWTWGASAPEKSPSVDVADFNGDGKRDFALVESQNQDGTGTQTLVVKPGHGNRTWSDEVNVYSDSNLELGVAAIRIEHSLKAGLLVDTVASNSRTAHFFINDTSGGYFGGCEFPSNASAIAVCSPTTFSSGSAKFDVSGAVQTTMRKMEVWIDGVKKYEQLADHDFSHYGVLDTTLTLSPGNHRATVIAAGYDNLEVKTTYTVTVK